MTTHRTIVDALATTAKKGTPIVLATVVRVTGSSYGGVGTRMVVRVDGSTVGIVSGGCLETDLAEQAKKVHKAGRAKVVTYDTRADDDTAWGLGLGCNGLIDVLLEPLPPVQAATVGRLLDHALSRSEEHTSELQSQSNLVCRLLLEKKKKKYITSPTHVDTSC